MNSSGRRFQASSKVLRFSSRLHTVPTLPLHQVANQKFADVVLDAYEEGDIIWVQVGGSSRLGGCKVWERGGGGEGGSSSDARRIFEGKRSDSPVNPRTTNVL